MTSKIILWILFFTFGFFAFFTEQNHNVVAVNGVAGGGKYVVWFVFVCFLVYTMYCSWRENLIQSVKKMFKLHWGRQIGIDLYLGLGISSFFIYLNEGSIWLTLFWLIPAMIYGNLALLFYLSLHYEMILSRFWAF
ncbi:hypothetical protein [Leptospira adleri]|uniref:Uncharacterized protein n=1 Tax=Leptospira adleri TaxID=2023186 RepID=A0A2M9YKP2_9LEPT|nr:hypothetical protein [Leptospira adleri]PJZ52119.1 hypothetical protein CH380_16940 [Leptospira adleri]PJZ62981.1 hypothetical protein CH376_05720 [Leptospira adleri]